jgi:integrase/recombinase XerD
LTFNDIEREHYGACPLGHSKLDTTALYTKVSTRTIHAVAGPLDRLMALMEGKTPPG